ASSARKSSSCARTAGRSAPTTSSACATRRSARCPRPPAKPRSAMRPQRSQYKLGKYDIVAQPAAGSMHMLRYTVLLNGKRLGALLSAPTESDCRFLEAPPKVPPLKIFSVTYRPGRPKKDAQKNADGESGPVIPWSIK